MGQTNTKTDVKAAENKGYDSKAPGGPLLESFDSLFSKKKKTGVTMQDWSDIVKSVDKHLTADSSLNSVPHHDILKKKMKAREPSFQQKDFTPDKKAQEKVDGNVKTKEYEAIQQMILSKIGSSPQQRQAENLMKKQQQQKSPPSSATVPQRQSSILTSSVSSSSSFANRLSNNKNAPTSPPAVGGPSSSSSSSSSSTASIISNPDLQKGFNALFRKKTKNIIGSTVLKSSLETQRLSDHAWQTLFMHKRSCKKNLPVTAVCTLLAATTFPAIASSSVENICKWFDVHAVHNYAALHSEAREHNSASSFGGMPRAATERQGGVHAFSFGNSTTTTTASANASKN